LPPRARARPPAGAAPRLPLDRDAQLDRHRPGRTTRRARPSRDPARSTRTATAQAARHLCPRRARRRRPRADHGARADRLGPRRPLAGRTDGDPHAGPRRDPRLRDRRGRGPGRDRARRRARRPLPPHPHQPRHVRARLAGMGGRGLLGRIGGDAVALLRFLGTLGDTPREALARNTTPPLVVRGTDDERPAEALAAVLPAGRYSEAPGDHVSALGTPELGACAARAPIARRGTPVSRAGVGPTPVQRLACARRASVADAGCWLRRKPSSAQRRTPPIVLVSGNRYQSVRLTAWDHPTRP
jgi:hypothetical protein